MNTRLFLAAVLLAVSVLFASSVVTRADGCAGVRCSLRSDGNIWCCNLNYETESPNACLYYNDTSQCECIFCLAD